MRVVEPHECFVARHVAIERGGEGTSAPPEIFLPCFFNEFTSAMDRVWKINKCLNDRHLKSRFFAHFGPKTSILFQLMLLPIFPRKSQFFADLILKKSKTNKKVFFFSIPLLFDQLFGLFTKNVSYKVL